MRRESSVQREIQWYGGGWREWRGEKEQGSMTKKVYLPSKKRKRCPRTCFPRAEEEKRENGTILAILH